MCGAMKGRVDLEADEIERTACGPIDLEVEADQMHECYMEEVYIALNRLSNMEADHAIARYLMTRGLKPEGLDFRPGKSDKGVES